MKINYEISGLGVRRWGKPTGIKWEEGCVYVRCYWGLKVKLLEKKMSCGRASRDWKRAGRKIIQF